MSVLVADEATWRTVYETASRVARTQFHFSPTEAEDVGQEMSVRAFLRMRQSEVNMTWIVRGATFLCIDRVRTQTAERNALALYSRTAVADVRPAEGVLSIALARLPPPCRKLIAKRFWEGHTWAELDRAAATGHRCAEYETRKCVERLRLLLDR